MKLFLVTRQDLSPGLRAAQLCHALRAFVEEHPAVDRKWFDESNTLVCLEAKTEDELRLLLQRASSEGVEVSAFLEPDINNALTAIALGPDGRRLVRRLPLAFS